MPEKENLTTISIVIDDDTGMYEIGEIEGIFSNDQLEYHLNMHGATRLLEHLSRLTAQVVEVDRSRRPVELMCSATPQGKE